MHIDDAVVGPIYRSLGLLIVAIWMWGVNVYYWTKHRISYVFIFEFNPRDRLTHYQIWHQVIIHCGVTYHRASHIALLYSSVDQWCMYVRMSSVFNRLLIYPLSI
jgi:hypothetical protein